MTALPTFKQDCDVGTFPSSCVSKKHFGGEKYPFALTCGRTPDQPASSLVPTPNNNNHNNNNNNWDYLKDI